MTLVPEEVLHLLSQGRLVRHLVSSKLWDQVDAVSNENSERMKEKPLHMPPVPKSRSSGVAHSFGRSASPSLNPEVCQRPKHYPVVPKWLYCRKSAVQRSAVRSNASSKFLQNYAGGRVRQPRTPNTSAERKFPKLITLKQYRVKRIVSPSTPTC